MRPSPGKILVIDDELHIAAAVTLALGRGYQVDAVADGREAFEVLKENERGFGILVVDHMMPGWAGTELIQRLQVAGFGGKCIVVSGYLSPEIEAIYHGLGVEHVIAKPFDVERIRSAVAASVRAMEDGEEHQPETRQR